MKLFYIDSLFCEIVVLAAAFQLTGDLMKNNGENKKNQHDDEKGCNLQFM